MPFRLLAAALAGACIWLAFPGVDLWQLAIVGTGLFALATAGVRPRTGSLVGFVLGVTWFLPLFAWSSTYAGFGAWLALALACALYPAAMGALVAYLQRDGAVRPLLVALAWVVMELARSVTPFGGFPWGRLGFSQSDSPLLGAASLVGTPGLGFLVALIGAFLALALQRARRGRLRGGVVLPAVTALALLLVPLAVPRPVDGEPIQVAAVQANLPPGFTWDRMPPAGSVLERYTDQTLDLARQVETGGLPAPDLVVWPESSVDLDPVNGRQAPQTTARIQQAVDAVGAPLLGGGTVYEGGLPSNTMLLYQPEVGLVDSYVKVYLAPFGEFMPLRSLLSPLHPLVDSVRDFNRGTEVGVVELPDGDDELRLGVAVCFEVVVDRAVRDSVLAGAELLVVPTNNAWFGESHEAVQQLAASRVKAVETGRSVVHSSNVGVSALITPDGTAHQQTGLWTQDLVSGELPLRTGTTVAVRLGPWPERVALLALAGVTAYTAWQRRRDRLTAPSPSAAAETGTDTDKVAV